MGRIAEGRGGWLLRLCMFAPKALGDK